MTPQPEHVWLVNAGLTATTERPAHAALKLRMVKNALHPASAITLGEMMILEPVGRLQVFVMDCVVLAHDGKRRIASAMTSCLASTHPPLGDFEHTLGFAVPVGVKDARLKTWWR